MKYSKKFLLLTFFVSAILIVAGCSLFQQSASLPDDTNNVGVSSETEEENGNIKSVEEGVDQENDDQAGTVKSFIMTARQWVFEPSTVTVNRGDTVQVTIESVDVTHGFAIPDFNVSERLEPGKTVNLEFVADKSGTFTFFCNVLCGSGHRDMKGTLIVN